MTIYLTESTDKNELKESYKNGLVFAVKLYPAEQPQIQILA